jgi:hypothetical protein
MSKTVLERTIDEKAATMGVRACYCEEPDINYEAEVFDGQVCKKCSKTIVSLSSEEYMAMWAARGWREETCGSCGGYGVKMVGDGEPFDCESCAGGTVWRSPKGHYALYPGGPFRG